MEKALNHTCTYRLFVGAFPPVWSSDEAEAAAEVEEEEEEEEEEEMEFARRRLGRGALRKFAKHNTFSVL